jgi:ectoine hydroxylase-related dioxygenase (phytanoyl-CoA dioxygenase family)
VLGDGVHNRSYNGNTNLPGSQRQPLHRDAEHLWPHLVHPTVTLIINISPIDVDETNAATEVWPGTHQILGPTYVSEDDEEQRRAVAPPVRVITRKGDAVLRDIRLWHRGVPNTSNAVRHMIAMSHTTRWQARGEPIHVTADAVPTFTDDVLFTPVAVVRDDYDYLAHRHG